MTVLQADKLTKDYRVRDGRRGRTLRAVHDVGFTLVPGRTTALVGQSGSGKSTLARLLLLLERPSAGRILLDGVPAARRGAGLRHYRRTVQLVFQDPFASLNPFHTVAHHLERPLRLHHPELTGAQVRERLTQLLDRVQLPAGLAGRRPHELSGGQRQRVAIARALAPAPGVLIADEPVSMLDVSIRLGVLNLLADLQRDNNLAVLYITHDLATARHFSDDILVLHRGTVVERGPADDVILRPQHAYTRTLAAAAPDPERRLRALRDGSTRR